MAAHHGWGPGVLLCVGGAVHIKRGRRGSGTFVTQVRQTVHSRCDRGPRGRSVGGKSAYGKCSREDIGMSSRLFRFYPTSVSEWPPCIVPRLREHEIDFSHRSTLIFTDRMTDRVPLTKPVLVKSCDFGLLHSPRNSHEFRDEDSKRAAAVRLRENSKLTAESTRSTQSILRITSAPRFKILHDPVTMTSRLLTPTN